MSLSHGSVVNRIMESGGPVPEVGMGATFCHWSDRSPGTVSEVTMFKSGPNAGTPRLVKVRADHVELISGSEQDGSAKYKITPNPESPEIEVKRTKRGWKTSGGTGVSFGHRDNYHDPHF